MSDQPLPNIRKPRPPGFLFWDEVLHLVGRFRFPNEWTGTESEGRRASLEDRIRWEVFYRTLDKKRNLAERFPERYPKPPAAAARYGRSERGDTGPTMSALDLIEEDLNAQLNQQLEYSYVNLTSEQCQDVEADVEAGMLAERMEIARWDQVVEWLHNALWAASVDAEFWDKKTGEMRRVSVQLWASERGPKIVRSGKVIETGDHTELLILEAKLNHALADRPVAELADPVAFQDQDLGRRPVGRRGLGKSHVRTVFLDAVYAKRIDPRWRRQQCADKVIQILQDAGEQRLPRIDSIEDYIADDWRGLRELLCIERSTSADSKKG